MKFDGVYKCGHEGSFDLVVHTNELTDVAGSLFEVCCPTCRYKELLDNLDDVQRIGDENETLVDLSTFPPLKGSEKQIEWAKGIRNGFISATMTILSRMKKIDMYLPCGFRDLLGLDFSALDYRNKFDISTLAGRQEYENWKIKLFKERKESITEDIYLMLNKIITSNNEATFYIDNRVKLMMVDCAYIVNLVKLKYASEVVYEIDKDIVKTAEIENKNSIVELAPENIKYPDIVRIEYGKDGIRLYYQKNEDFIKFAKVLGYRWLNNCWTRFYDISIHNPNFIVETAVRLLGEGFRISFVNTNGIKCKIINGDYTPYNDKWLFMYGEVLRVVWDGKNDELYNKFKKIPKSKYDRGGIEFPISMFAEVMDVSNIFGFSVDEDVIKSIDEYKKKLSEMEIVKPQNSTKSEKVILELETTGGIINDLLDE